MIQETIQRALELVDEEQSQDGPSRELSLVRTKLEEAELWLQRASEAPIRQQRRAAEREAAKLEDRA